MTRLEHVRFTFQVHLTTDTHIGDGREVRLSELCPNAPRATLADNRDADPRIATIARDHAGKPTLPATALKGALRKALTASLPPDEILALFGVIKEDGGGAMGRFAFYAGKMEQAGRSQGLPYAEYLTDTWLATHVAISRRTGAADPMKLYTIELVPAGTVFEVCGVWFGTLDDAKTGLATLLAPLATPEGLTIGAGGRTGLGAMKLSAGSLTLTRTAFDAATGMVRTEAAGGLAIKGGAVAPPDATLKLRCRGPFATVDPTPRRGDNRGNVIHALKRDDETPVLHAETVAGALRQRAAWLSAVNGWGGDDPFRKPDTWTDPAELTPVERLFGVGGWRGLLRISAPKDVTAKAADELTSISIDRFSGAVLDSTLFTHEVFVDVSCSVDLRLDRRPGVALADRDRDLLKLLVEDLHKDSLLLGHATNRGFGWFDVDATLSGDLAQ